MVFQCCRTLRAGIEQNMSVRSLSHLLQPPLPLLSLLTGHRLAPWQKPHEIQFQPGLSHVDKVSQDYTGSNGKRSATSHPDGAAMLRKAEATQAYITVWAYWMVAGRRRCCSEHCKDPRDVYPRNHFIISGCRWLLHPIEAQSLEEEFTFFCLEVKRTPSIKGRMKALLLISAEILDVMLI